MCMNEQEFMEIANSISNEEVPEIVFGIIYKIHVFLEKISQNMNEIDNCKYNIFKSFFKIYNTTLNLSRGTSYVFNKNISYIDIKSIYNEIRICHELYLIFNYLVTSTIGGDQVDETDFKYLCYRLSGALDNKRTYERIKKISDHKENYEREIANLRNEISECSGLIKKSPIYDLLSSKIKGAVLRGNWRVDMKRELSWNDLLAYTPMSRDYGSLEYHTLSMYAHTSYGSIQLESQHDYNMTGALSHLYKLSALFSISAINAFKISQNIIDKREIVLIIDLRNMGEKMVERQCP